MRYDIEVEGIGTMSHLGRSRHWRGEVDLPGGEEPIWLEVDGTPDGPSPVQIEAIRAAIAAWPGILSDAERGLTELLRASELPMLPPWEAFQVQGLSVPAESYDATGAVHVLIGLAHVDHPDDFLPAIDVVDGRVAGVLSGT